MAKTNNAPDVEQVENENTAQDEQQTRQDMLFKLDAFGQSLARTRSEAIAGRQQTGIENIWYEDEEFYEGIDDANRHEHKHTWRTKPPGQIQTTRQKNDTSSSVFPNITRPYVDMASARVADMLMPTDDRAFAIDPTPIPDLVNMSKGIPPKNIAASMNMQFMGDPEGAQNWLLQQQDQAQQIMAEAKRKANNAQERIDDWMEECQYTAEGRRALEDAARIGTGILKGPIPRLKKIKVYTENGLIVQDELKPASKRIDPWNFYPDPACGESIHNGGYTWERDRISKRQLRDLKRDSNYISENIDACIQEGPQEAKAQYEERPNIDNERKGMYEIWYYYGVAEREDLDSVGASIESKEDVAIPVMIVMVNNHVIKIAENHLDTGDFPYDVMVWQRRSGHWAGIGVARQIRTPQRMVTAATRNLMDNAGIAAGPMLVFMQGVLSPADGELSAKPRKVFTVGEDARGIDDARKAIGEIKFDMMVNELIEIINLGLRFAEDVTGMPMILQGQLGKAPDTVGGMQMLFNSASSVLRRLAKLWDDMVTEPHVNRYYTYLLQYSEDDDEKGDFMINARGSSALVERSIQNEQLPQLLNASANPLYKLDPVKTAQEWLKSLRFDKTKFQFDDENWQKMVENWQQIMEQGAQQGDPRLAIAQLNAESKLQIEQMKGQNEAAKQERQQAFEASLKQFDANVKTQLEALKKQGVADDVLAKIKADIAKETMRLNTQIKLANQTQVATPSAEPPGRAPDGQAFQK